MELPETLAEVRAQLRAFAGERLAAGALRREAEGVWHDGVWEELTGLGLDLLALPEERGGAGLGRLGLVVAVEELARADAAVAVALALHAAVREALAERLPGGPAGMALGGAGEAGEVLVAPAGASGWAVPWGGGFRWVAAEGAELAPWVGEGEPLGLRALRVGRLSTEHAAEAPPLDGVAVASVLLGLGAAALGSGEAALGLAVDYARERRQFGRPIAAFQGVQWLLADARTRLDAARWLLWRAASGEASEGEARAARRACVEAGVQAADAALQVHGGMGYVREVPVERHLRDALACGAFWGGARADRTVHAGALLAG